MALSMSEVITSELLTRRDWQVGASTTALPPSGTISSASVNLQEESPDLIVTAPSDAPAWLAPTADAIDRLLGLEENWDSYGAARISVGIAIAALDFAFTEFDGSMTPPVVVPTSSGGLQFEWHTAGIDLEIEFTSPTRVMGFFEDREPGEVWEEDLSFNRQPLIRALSVLAQRHQG